MYKAYQLQEPEISYYIISSIIAKLQNTSVGNCKYYKPIVVYLNTFEKKAKKLTESSYSKLI